MTNCTLDEKNGHHVETFPNTWIMPLFLTPSDRRRMASDRMGWTLQTMVYEGSLRRIASDRFGVCASDGRRMASDGVRWTLQTGV